MILAFDLDGTLLEVDYDDPEAFYSDPHKVKHGAQPHPDVPIGRLENHTVLIVTGRCNPPLHDTTVLQLREAGLERTWDRLYMQSSWNGYEAMADWKAEILEATQGHDETGEDVPADLYVGDHEADEQAANQAGVPFLHADEFHDLSPYKWTEVLLKLSGSRYHDGETTIP